MLVKIYFSYFIVWYLFETSFLLDINYFYCKRIIEILKETEADTKNLFGSYGSQRMKDWLEIEKLYLKDNVYLAEACDLLVQNIKYHIPAVKKQIAKTQSGQTVRL